jgi:hypothetical protein
MTPIRNVGRPNRAPTFRKFHHFDPYVTVLASRVTSTGLPSRVTTVPIGCAVGLPFRVTTDPIGCAVGLPSRVTSVPIGCAVALASRRPSHPVGYAAHPSPHRSATPSTPIGDVDGVGDRVAFGVDGVGDRLTM